MPSDTTAPVLLTGGLGAMGPWVVRRLLDEARPFVVYEAREDYALLPDLRETMKLGCGKQVEGRRSAC